MTHTESGEHVICPYCGHQHGDAAEYCSSDNPHKTECDGCGREFVQWAEYDVTYYAKSIEPIHPIIRAARDRLTGAN